MSKEKLIIGAYEYAKSKKLTSIDVIDAYIAGATRELELGPIVEDMNRFIKQVEYNTRRNGGWSEDAQKRVNYTRKALDVFVESFNS